ncbi:MAG TPA: CPBP family intramembrane glutamic endopeptidase [Candidatus Dormibacteraeota bacterium]|nr:CPBP family intramembrane glutamic endopeptidase [Candidatus Dormibacteraeota bacterium]
MLQPIASAIRAPAAWCFAAVWAASGVLLALRGEAELALLGLGQLTGVLALTWIMLLVTAPVEWPPERGGSWRSRSQLAVVALAVVLTGVDGMVFHRVGPTWLGSIPLWSGLVRALLLGGQALRLGASFSNLVTYVILPLAILLALGVRAAQLGLTRSRSTARVLAVWATLPALGALAEVVLGGRPPLALLMTLAGNVLQNGFSEEFLFRGALLTRVAAEAGPAWGVVVSSLVFGLWHLGANWSGVHGDPVAAACAGICTQGSLGLGLGMVFVRTRSLLAGTVVHILLDAV